jgi:hypothetical protein
MQPSLMPICHKSTQVSLLMPKALKIPKSLMTRPLSLQKKLMYKAVVDARARPQPTAIGGLFSYWSSLRVASN